MQIIHNYENKNLSKLIEEIERDYKENQLEVQNISLSSVCHNSGNIYHYAIVIYKKIG